MREKEEEKEEETEVNELQMIQSSKCKGGVCLCGLVKTMLSINIKLN